MEPLIVFQMGKVGSTAIVHSLKALCLDRPIYHVHFLTREGIAEAQRVYAAAHPQAQRGSGMARSRHLQASEGLFRQIKQSPHGRKWQVITLVRDPIARNISAFFQLLDLSIPDFVERYERKALSTEQLAELFLAQRMIHDTPLTWHDRELQQVFGIDVFSTVFPYSRGYEIYHNTQADILLIRLENLDQCGAQALRDFMGIDSFKLIGKNVGSKKTYAAVYRDVLENIRLPGDYIDRMYSSKYARHFYSAEEIAHFRLKWIGPRFTPSTPRSSKETLR
jgi:hypothetical protein